MKKVLLFFVMISLSIILLPLSAFSAEDFETEDLKQSQRTELKSLNKEDCSFYKNPDGSITAELDLKPSLAANNQLIETTKDAKVYYQNQSNRFKANFAHQPKDQLMDFNCQESSISMKLEDNLKSNISGKVAEQKMKYSEILSSTDIEYQVLDNGVKETIILKDQNAPEKITFRITANNLNWQAKKNGRIDFYSSQDHELLFYINPLYTTDAAGKTVDAVTLSLEEEQDGLVYTINIDKQKLNEKSYPVCIDPTVTIAPNAAESMDVEIFADQDEDDNAGASPYIYIHQGHNAYSEIRGLFKFNLSSLPPGAINSAYLWLTDASQVPAPVKCYKVTKEWLESEANWVQAKCGEEWTSSGGDYTGSAYPFSQQGPDTYRATITPLVNGWVNGSTPNYGVLVMAQVVGPDEEVGMSCFYSGDYSGSYATSRRPKLIVTYQPDTTSPSTSITQPAKNSILSGNVTISANASDSYGIDRVEFYANSTAGESLIGTDTTAPYQANWDTRLYPNGSYTLRVKAYDNAGNMGTGTDLNYTVTVNNVLTPPTGLTAQITSEQEVQLHWTLWALAGLPIGYTEAQVPV